MQSEAFGQLPLHTSGLRKDRRGRQKGLSNGGRSITTGATAAPPLAGPFRSEIENEPTTLVLARSLQFFCRVDMQPTCQHACQRHQAMAEAIERLSALGFIGTREANPGCLRFSLAPSFCRSEGIGRARVQGPHSGTAQSPYTTSRKYSRGITRCSCKSPVPTAGIPVKKSTSGWIGAFATGTGHCL